VARAGEGPQYLVFNRAPWRPGEDWWDQNKPESINATKLRQVVDGLDAPENPSLLVGVSFIFSILESDTSVLEQCLRNLTAASEETGIPVMVLLDGYTWWETRSDLWNWWDPSLPGYDPANARNVEWTDWSPESAVKIGWRNWGHQFRVRPCPNLSSPRLMKETISRLRPLLAFLVAWQRNLPPEKKHLFAGLKIGWEVGVGYNHWYYPNGNEYLEEWPDDPSHDPQTGLEVEKGWPCGMPKLGYAAVKTAGIRESGELTVDDVSTAIQRYLAELCRVTSEAGMPRDLVFAHMGGNYAPWEKHFPFTPAMNQWSLPSYSLYGQLPEDAGDLGKKLDDAEEPTWAVAEWFHWAPDADGWKRNLERTLSFKDCRFVNVYNWEEIKKYPEGIEGVRKLLAEYRTSQE